jgi:cell division septum initiation protein DivIVA
MDELKELQAELVGARANVERLTEDVADREARVQTMVAEMESLRRGVEAARAEAVQVRVTAEEEARRLTERYRAALLQSLPDVRPDLIRGESLDDLDRAAALAREMASWARDQAQTTAAARVPAGSPARAAQDIEALSPSEKIRLGIQEKQ